MNSKLGVVLLAIGMLLGVLITAPPAAALAAVTLDPPKFDGFYYVPTEQIQFTINIVGGDPRDYDLLVVFDDGVTRTNWSGDLFDDVNIPVPQTSITLNFDLPANIPDGDWYRVEVNDPNWIENGGGGVGRVQYDNVQFSIRTWRLNLELDRSRYLPGDTVTVIWTVNLIKDGSLAPSGFGQLWVWDWPTNNCLLRNCPGPFQYTASSGTYSLTLLGTIPTTRQIRAYSYFNSTASAADQTSFDFEFRNVDGLRMIVGVPAASYEPGAIVTVDVAAKNTDFPPVPSDPGAEGVEVDITVTDQLTGQVVPQYGVQNLVTDAHGNLRHVFQLNSSIPDGTPFLVGAAGVANNAVTAFGTDAFTVSTNAGMTLVLRFNKEQYLSGETVTMTAEVAGSSGPFTFIYEARDGAFGGSLLNRTTSNLNTYQYRIPDTFAGQITFSATADDGQGNRVTSSRVFNVVLGILTVTLDRSEYTAGTAITAAFALTSRVMQSPTFYYEIFDTSVFPNVLVRSGVAAAQGTSGSVAYTVPQVPANSYTFRITAAETGRAIVGSASASLVSGVLLQITLDKAAYARGDTIRIGYTLIPRGRTALPSSFSFLISLTGAPSRTVQTTSPSGELTLSVPAEMNEGAIQLVVWELNTGAFAAEVVRIGNEDLLSAWAPTLVVVLSLLMILVFLMVVLMWRKVMPGMLGAPRGPGRPSGPAPPPPATAAAGPAPMAVTCRSCGSAIEITTSKRPIEVMCPSCGETQMVQ